MPEGHTIHRLARDLRRDLVGVAPVASSPQGRFSEGAGRLDGVEVTGTEAAGKHLFVDCASGEHLHVHLGLIGKFRRQRPPAAEPRDSVRLRLESDSGVWDLVGPNVCELIDDDQRTSIMDRLGPDPLRRNGSVDEFVRRLSRRRIPLGVALLNQEVIAGLGNVYRAEICWIASIDPRRPANSLSEEEAGEIWDLSVEQLRLGERLNRIVTVDPSEFNETSARKLGRDERLYVYKRHGQPCRRCSADIEFVDMGARSMWWCPTCQG